MQVILKQAVENLGRTGDVVNVSDGYARNFLLPRGLVVKANAGNLSEMEHYKRILDKKRQAEISSAQELAERINQVKISAARKVGDQNKLFGSVSAADLVKSLADQGLEVKRTQIQLKDPIKSLGEHQITVRVASDIEATLTVEVTAEAE